MTEKEEIRSRRRSMESVQGAIETPSSMHSSNGMKPDKEKLKAKRNCVPPYESDMMNIVGYIKSNPHITLPELALPEEKLFNLVMYLMRKPIKNHYELHVIRLYLYTLPNFIGILSNKVIDDFNEILTRIAYYIQCECLDKDSVLFRVGDKGDKFYILLSGKLAILVAKDVRMRMDEHDYVKHLLKLKSVGENEIMIKTIQVNRHIYPVDEDNIEEYLNSLVENQQLEGVSDLKNLLDRNFVLSKLKSSSSLLRKSTLLAGIVPSNSNKSSLKRASNVIFFAKASLKKGLTKRNSLIRRNSQIGQNLGLGSITDAKATGSSGFFSVDDYLNFTKPEAKQYRRDDDMYMINKLPEVTLWQYHNILTLKSGSTFGEVALELSSQKRTATIISTEECVLGSLSRDIYNDCIREANEKARRSNIAFILNSQIFKNINKQTFEKKQLLNLFINCKFRQGELLFDEHSDSNFIYLIKDGEYQVYMNKSLHDINILIKEFGGNPEEDLDRKLFMNEIAYNKFMHTKHKFRISSLKDKDIVGLSDYVYNNKYYCRVICNSSKGEAFKLNKQFYDNLCQGEKLLRDNYNDFVNIKKKILLEKLINFKKIRISCFKDMNEERRDGENQIIFKTSPNNDVRKNQIFIKISNFKINKSKNDRDRGDLKSKREHKSVSPNTKRLLNINEKDKSPPISLKKLNLSERPEFFIRENTEVKLSNKTENKNSSFVVEEEENIYDKLNIDTKPSNKFSFHGHQNSKLTKISAFSEIDELILDRQEMNKILKYNLVQTKEIPTNSKSSFKLRKKSLTNHNLPNLMKTIDMVNTSQNESSSIKILEKEDMKLDLNTSEDNINQHYDFDNLDRILPERVKFQNGISTPIEEYVGDKILKSSPSKLKAPSENLKILLKSFNLRSPTSGSRVSHQGNYINYTRIPVIRSVKKRNTNSQFQTKNAVYNNSHVQTYQSTQTCQSSSTPTASSTVYKNNIRQFYHQKKNSFNKSNMLLNYSTSARDKEILNNIIDKMVYTNINDCDMLENTSKSKPKKIITDIKEVPMIDCLVLDRMIENSQLNQNQINSQVYSIHSSIYSSNPNTTNGFKDYNFRLPDTPNTLKILPFTCKNKTAPIKLSKEKINLIEKNNILMTNKAKQLFSFGSNKKLKNYSHLLENEGSSASENFLFNDNFTATAYDKNFRPKKYKIASTSRTKINN